MRKQIHQNMQLYNSKAGYEFSTKFFIV